MKKFFAIAVAAIVAFFNVNTASAQMFDANEMENYAKEMYGNKWTVAAVAAADDAQIDQEGNLTISKTIQAPGMSKEDLYYEMANYFVGNYKNSIQMAEKSDGLIIARPYISNITTAAFGWNAYKFDICPLIRIKATDGQVDITYTLKDYGVAEDFCGGNVSAAVACTVLAGAAVAVATTPRHSTTVVEHHYGRYGHYHHTVVEHVYRSHDVLDDILLVCAVSELTNGSRYDDSHTVWNINNCYPFCNKDSHKKASAKAFVMATTYSQAVMEDIEAVISQSQLACRN